VHWKDFAYNFSGYADLSIRLFNRLTLNPGLRYDYTGFAAQNTLAPRISGSIAMDEKQSINLQRVFITKIPLIQTSLPNHRSSFKSERAYQYILGYRDLFYVDLKLTAESWYKNLTILQ